MNYGSHDIITSYIMQVDTLFLIIILVISVIIHEVSHGYVAELLGDPTARLAGRLTLNPIPHLDLFGSILLPALLIATGSPLLFGWAKPVPVNFYNLKNQRWGPALVGAAGALSNFFIALVFGILIRFSPALGISAPSFLEISGSIVALNILLGVFNLLPVPPLDGSKILFALLPHRFHAVETFLTRYWIIFLMIIFLWGWQIIGPIVDFIVRVIIGR
jgi:Zn-dependent protease